MRRAGLHIGLAGLIGVGFLLAPPRSLGQWPGFFRYQGPTTPPPGLPNMPARAGQGYGGGNMPYIGVFTQPYMGGYGSGGYSGYDPGVASVPSAAYFTYGRTSYTTESPSPIPVYAPPRMPYVPLPAGMPLTALLKVQVPLDAEVWLEGQKMRSTGEQRHYRSPPLDPAKGYLYEVKARWLVDGKTVEDVRHIAIRAGATVVVDFKHLDPLIPRPSLPPEPPKVPAKSSEPETTDKPTR